ncbi:MAG: hypothetical protein AAGE90_13610 [Pseudomonadota bacterium]
MSNPFETQASLVAGMAALWSAAAVAGLSAVMANATRPWVSGDVYAPFGRNFSMDIDPVTSWFLPGLFGHARGSRQAATFMERFIEQQLLIRALIEACHERRRAEGEAEKWGEARDADTAAMIEMQLPIAQFRQLAAATDEVEELMQRGRRV